MKLKDYLDTRDGAIKENKYSRMAIAILAACVLALVIGLVNKSTTVVFVPPTLTEQSELSDSHASKEYLIAQGMFLTNLLGNVTPRSAPSLKGLVSRHLSSRLYNGMMESIDAQVKEIQQEQITLSFAPTVARYDSNLEKVIITGELVIRGLRGQEKRELRTYELGFNTTNHVVTLDSMRLMEGAYEPDKNAAPAEE